jgi:hypothetical protein
VALLLPDKEINMAVKLFKWGAIAFAVYSMIHFAPDLQRYVKMSRM